MPNIESTHVGDRDHVGVPAPVAEEREPPNASPPESTDLGTVVLDPHLALVEHEEPAPREPLRIREPASCSSTSNHAETRRAPRQ